MGIPSYFSYVVRNLKCKREMTNTTFQCLFMDCNSIVYDTHNAVSSLHHNSSLEEYQNVLIDGVIQQIEKHIKFISPTKLTFVALDGVAPLAKMKHQRNRRYRTAFINDLCSKMVVSSQSSAPQTLHGWNTAHITPGTKFMNLLNKRLHEHFEQTSHNCLVIVSGSNEVGEGEHKIFQHMRSHNHSNDCTALYGLDADLIMLSLLHVHLCDNIFIFREEPHFGNKNKQQIKTTTKENMLFMDVKQLSLSVLNEMNCKCNNKHRVYDYVFMCMLFGNDFLPHFPCLNLKTNGMHILLNHYRKYIGEFHHKSFVHFDETKMENSFIHWKTVKSFIKELAKIEHECLVQEINNKNMLGCQQEQKINWNTVCSSREEFENVLNQIPVMCREVENYICPVVAGWEKRYYKSLFSTKTDGSSCDNKFVQQTVFNYLEGLEWVFKYYVSGCVDWNWCFMHDYPPLLSDLALYFPEHKVGFSHFHGGVSTPCSPLLQLMFVIPPCYYDNIFGVENACVLKKHFGCSHNDVKHQWAFCRFYWEGHLVDGVEFDDVRKIEGELVCDVF